MEEPGCLFAHGSFRRTGAVGLVLAQGGRLRRGPGPNPLPPSHRGLPSAQLARLHHGTVPAPTLRRLASAPLVRTRLRNDIAELGAPDKNKVRTHMLLPCRVIPGRSAAEGKGIHGAA